MSLEQYARERPAFRTRVLEHKARGSSPSGPNATWCFEDRLTVQYQVQEMLRAERIFEPEGIAEELGAYNPLIPDGSNWKVTLLIEFPDPSERAPALAQLKGIEHRCWVQVAGQRARVRDRGRGSASARTTRRPRRCTSCASSCAADDRGLRGGRGARRSASITSTTATTCRRARAGAAALLADLRASGGRRAARASASTPRIC